MTLPMPKYRIYAGLGGGYGGATEFGVYDCATLEEAERIGYEEACQQFDSQAGCGMDGWDEFMDEATQSVSKEDYEDDESSYESALEDYANQVENEARESWIEYYAVLVGSDEDTDYEEETNETE